MPTASPVITARADNTAAAVLQDSDGHTRIQGDDLDHTRSLIIAHAQDAARHHDQPVTLNTADPDGEWWLIVHPDGGVEPTTAPPTEQTPSASSAPTGTARDDTMDAEVDAELDGDNLDWPDPDAVGPGGQAPTEHGSDAATAEPAPAMRSVPQPGPIAGDRNQLATVTNLTWQPTESWYDTTDRHRQPADHSPATPQPVDPAPRPRRSSPPAPAAGGRSRTADGPPAHKTANHSPQAPTGPYTAAHTQPRPTGPAQPVQPAQQPYRPTAADLRASQPVAPAAPASWGWRSHLRTLTGGLIKLNPGPAELAHRDAIHTVQKNLNGPKTIVVANPKGGAAKTPTVALLAATFGQQRGGYTLAWDNNESHGTLADRSLTTRHNNTALDLLHDLDGFKNSSAARVGDLDNYVRPQGDGQYDVLASNGDIERNTEIDADAYDDLHTTLARFYRVMVIDTGNNPIATAWAAAIASADLLVIPATPRDDRIRVAAELIDRLRLRGYDHLVDNAVFLLSNHTPGAENPATTADARQRAISHFSRHVRAVVEVPFDPAIDAGGPIQIDRLNRSSREAWLQAGAAVAEGI